MVGTMTPVKDKLIAEWFWTDRWTGSSAFLLPLEARGLYREMLTQSWRRGGQLPANPDTIKRAIAATDAEWARTWPAVAAYWRLTDGGVLVNDTQVEIYQEAQARVLKASSRGAKGAQGRWHGNGHG
jgi:uncharacterized protein YdaU (DUF1376 family)